MYNSIILYWLYGGYTYTVQVVRLVHNYIMYSTLYWLYGGYKL